MYLHIKTKKLNKFLEMFKENERGDILFLLYSLNKVINLPKKTASKLNEDYLETIKSLHLRGFSAEEIANNLNVKNLGDFYANSDDRWYLLDNAAKIYPLSMKSRWMAMFRMSVYLKDKVDPNILQMALNFTIKRFPYFAVCLKNGVFWHYLEGINTRFEVTEENMRPMSTVDVSDRQVPFRVVYFENRISVEYFHILTDGTGGSIFLKTLVGQYFKILGEKFEYGDGFWDVNEKPKESEWENAFLKADKIDNPRGFNQPLAMTMKGKISKYKPYQVLSFEMDSEKLYQKSKETGVTVTAYILDIMSKALKESVKPYKNRKIQIEVPKNLRAYYPCNVMNNFTLFGMLYLDTKEIGKSYHSQKISENLRECTSKPVLDELMNGTNKLVKQIAYIPRVVKSVLVKPIYGIVGDRVMTTVLSNMGVEKAPSEILDKIDKMDFLLGPSMGSGAVCAMISINKKTVFSITKMVKDDTFEEKMYELLTRDNIEVKVWGSEKHEKRKSIEKEKKVRVNKPKKEKKVKLLKEKSKRERRS